jgi:hypothetical protein
MIERKLLASEEASYSNCGAREVNASIAQRVD